MAVPRCERAHLRPLILPDDVARASVDGVDPVELRHEHHAVGDDGYGLDVLLTGDVVHPFGLQVADSRGVSCFSSECRCEL